MDKSEDPATLATSCAMVEQPTLCKFFSEDKGAGDKEGKAFFDSVSAKLQDHVEMGRDAVEAAAFEGLSVDEELELPDETFPLRSIPLPCSEDPFSASLQASELDRQHDAWIPSSSTHATLASVARSALGTYFPERDQLTMPGIILEEDLVDPVKDLMLYHMGEEASKTRKTLTVEEVPQDENGLRQLIESGNYRAAVNLTGRLLAMHGQGVGKAGYPTKITPHILQIWFTRVALLVKLRQFAVAELEVAPFATLDRPDLFYEFYPNIYGKRTGSMVPFAFRLLLAELPLHLSQFPESLNRLYTILAVVEQIIGNLEKGLAENGNPMEWTEGNRAGSLKLWNARRLKVYFAILNCLLSQKDYASSVEVMSALVEAKACPEQRLSSLLGRIYLQLGDFKAAQECFLRAARTEDGVHRTEELMNSGLINIALNKFDEAYERFKEASEINPESPVIINNMAVCLLYLGRLRDALALLEGVVERGKFLHEGILFNLCTLFELESSHSSERKQGLLTAVAATLGDGFNIACLKLPMAS